MYPLRTVFTLVALVAAAAGQSSNSTTLGIEAIEAHFSNSGLVPSLLKSFNPTALLNVTYDGVGTISPGQSLTKAQVSPTPSLQVTPANSTVVLNGTFTVIMADAGAVGTDESQGQTRHWLVNDVTIDGGSAPFNVSTDDGTAITEYAGPAPQSGSGAHRYVILLYSQPDSFDPPSDLSNPGAGVSVFDLSDYVQSSDLGPLVAATYLTVEQGTATFTPSSTAPVVTSTLPAAQSASSTSSTTTSSAATASASKGSQSNNAKPNAVSMMGMLLAGCISYLILGM